MIPNKKFSSPYACAERKRIETELAAIPPLTPAQRKLLTIDGFIDYYLSMRDLYRSYDEAYGKLEEYYIAITGHRRYSDIDSIRMAIQRFHKT